MYINSKYESLPALKAVGARYLSRHNSLWRIEKYDTIKNTKGENIGEVPASDPGVDYRFGLLARSFMENYLSRARAYILGHNPVLAAHIKTVYPYVYVHNVDNMKFWELYANIIIFNGCVCNVIREHEGTALGIQVGGIYCHEMVDFTYHFVIKYLHNELAYSVEYNQELNYIPAFKWFTKFNREFPGVFRPIPFECDPEKDIYVAWYKNDSYGRF